MQTLFSIFNQECAYGYNWKSGIYSMLREKAFSGTLTIDLFLQTERQLSWEMWWMWSNIEGNGWILSKICPWNRHLNFFFMLPSIHIVSALQWLCHSLPVYLSKSNHIYSSLHCTHQCKCERKYWLFSPQQCICIYYSQYNWSKKQGEKQFY